MIWAPFVTTQRMSDLETLASSALFAEVLPASLHHVTQLLDAAVVPAGAAVATRGEPMTAAFGVLEGRLAGDGSGMRHGIGTFVGVGALGGRAPWTETIVAEQASRIVRLSHDRFDGLVRSHPAVAVAVARAAIALADAAVHAAGVSTSGAGARVMDVLPPSIDGQMVVAARRDHRTLALDAPAPEGVVLEPVTVRDWEGRDIYRRTAGLVFLEAAARIGRTDLSLGPSWTTGKLVLGARSDEDHGRLASDLMNAMTALVAEAHPIVEEAWPVDEAVTHFRDRGRSEVASLLETGIQDHVRLVTCGTVRVPSPGPMLPNTRMLSSVAVAPLAGGLALDFGEIVRRELVARPQRTMMLEAEAPRYGSDMTKEEARWLEVLGLRGVGALNRSVVTGEVRDLIRVNEGFHEKRLGQLADLVRSRPNARVIAVSGPSSSGKTTFLDRLKVQLVVNGIRPTTLSVDDYYVEREKTVRDASGEYDYEALEAVELGWLQEDVARVAAGEKVRSAAYDFIAGKSTRHGPREMELAPGGVLVLEGIHALNPALLPDLADELVIRVFVHPATTMSFDPLTTLEPADVRLLRRIVRDRHGRGATAEANLARWPSVRRGERLHVFPHLPRAHYVFDTSLLYEVGVLKVFAERYLLEVPRSSPQYPAALKLRRLLAPFIPIHPEHVPPSSFLREFIGT